MQREVWRESLLDAEEIDLDLPSGGGGGGYVVVGERVVIGTPVSTPVAAVDPSPSVEPLLAMGVPANDPADERADEEPRVGARARLFPEPGPPTIS